MHRCNTCPFAMCTCLTPTQSKSRRLLSLSDDSITKKMSEHIKTRPKLEPTPWNPRTLVLIDMVDRQHGQCQLGMKTFQDKCQAMFLWPCSMHELPPPPKKTHTHEHLIHMENPLGSSVACHEAVGHEPYTHVTCNTQHCSSIQGLWHATSRRCPEIRTWQHSTCQRFRHHQPLAQAPRRFPYRYSSALAH